MEMQGANLLLETKGSMIGQIVSHYRIIRPIGSGGMGTVYVAEDMLLGRSVAIKFPATDSNDHHLRARFLREARAASALNHPNIAAIYDYGQTEQGQPFIVMELITGKTLGCMMEEGKLSLGRALEIVRDVALALSEAHSHGIVHRDIKPSNVIIDERANVKVLDFGLAKHINGEAFKSVDADASTLLATWTQSGIVVGTPLYLSPEQAMGQNLDARSDLFALGTVLYEAIAGRPPFAGRGMIEIAALVIHVDPQPPSTFNPRVPAELDRLSLKTLAKKPEERYQSAEDLISDLENVRARLQEEGVDQTRTVRIHAAHETARTSALATLSEMLRRPRVSVGILLVSLAIVSIVLWGLKTVWQPKLPPPSAEALKWYQLGTNASRIFRSGSH